jgi:hypothetical protein
MMDNPKQALIDYMRRHHSGLEMQPVRSFSREKGVKAWVNHKFNNSSYGFEMMLPRSAPEGGRPLCTKVATNGKIVWEFISDHKSFHGVQQKVRVHLHQFQFGQAKQFALVEVIEGDPDRVSKVFRIDGDEFSLDVEVLMKVQIARLWGMRVRSTKEEQRALDRLLKPTNTQA